ncbi:uncharacterized protein LOC135335651 [Halichondria panicea]|uniref:uncharacterized protein LOC135335651 n=1 Tax=Halichondria panicea TaxID=6063 RepID=UPI00312B8C79
MVAGVHQIQILLVLSIIIGLNGNSVEPSCSKMDADVLILGAGMAGISAAKTLSDAGVKNLIILEGRSEIGGRIRSEVLEATGVRVELGANWIEDLDPNNLNSHPLWQLAKQCGGLAGNFQDGVIFGPIHAFDDHKRNLTANSTFLSRLNHWENVGHDIKSYLTNATKNHDHLLDVSARQALQQFGWVPETAIDKAIEWLGFDWECACPPENGSFLFSFPMSRDYMYFVTDQKQGYVKLVHCLADSFLSPLDNRLHLGSTVQEVKWYSGDQCVCVTTIESGVNKEYCAASAVLTFAIGVLKSDHVVFNPPLPSPKLEAISKIGDGYYLKLFVEFSEVFWDKDKVPTILHVSSNKGYYAHFQSLAQNLPGNPPILIATLIGEYAIKAYTLSNSQIKSQVTEVLRNIFGPSVPEPIAITVPDWGVNSLYNGMYSYRSYGFTQSDLDALRINAGSLYFAGEALVNDGEYGFVHSALKSGIETAEEILKRGHV